MPRSSMQRWPRLGFWASAGFALLFLTPSPSMANVLPESALLMHVQPIGEGCATAATRAAIAILFARTDLDAVWAVHLVDNVASARVMEKCGLRVLREEERTHRGQPRAFHVRGIARAAWDALRGCG